MLALLLVIVCQVEPPGEVALDAGLQSVHAEEFEPACLQLEQALWWDPSLTEAYVPLSIAYEKTGKLDLALYFATRQLELLLGAEKPDAKAIAGANARLAELIGDLGPQTKLTTMTPSVPVALAKSYLAKKYYQSAAFWLSQALALDPGCKDVAPLQEQVVKNTTGGAALKMQKMLTERSPAWIARQDKLHKDWKNAYGGRTKYYSVKTNIGYEVYQTMFWSMDQMNQFYRKVFGYKGSDPPVLNVQVFATREEFDKKREMPQGVKGYYDSTEIVSYDSRVDGVGVEFVYQTLFHEASHQFIDLITGVKPPMYLNEGISSYFEGARILPDGTVQTNEIPDHRILGVANTFDTDKEISLEQLIKADKEQYDGLHYCYGWGLIYYLLNKEDESAGNPYRAPLMKVLEAYKKGGKHEVVKRFEDIVLKPVEGPKTLAELQPIWKKWMQDLIAEYRQGPTMVQTWLSRGKSYLEKGKFDKAEAALKRVLLLVPEQPEALLLLARTYQRKKDDDRALSHLLLLRDQASARGAVLEEADKLMASLDPIRGERDATEFEQRKAVLEHSARLAAKDLPRAALLELTSYERAFGPHADIRAELTAFEKKGVNLRRWHSLFRGDSFPNWEASKALATDGTKVTMTAEKAARTVREHGLYAPPFQVHLRTGPIPAGAIFGLVYGWRGGEHGKFVAWSGGKDRLLDGHYDFKIEDDGGWVPQPVADEGGPAKAMPTSEITFTFTEDTLKVTAGDEVLLLKALEPGIARGQLGLVLQEGVVDIKKLEIEQ